MVMNDRQEWTGTTSIRYFPRDDRDLKYDEVLKRSYYGRDRDLGQTFTTGDQRVALQAITLRIGPSESAVKPGAPGALVSMQILKVHGTAVVHDNGTRQPPTRWRTWSSQVPFTDDFVTGLSFEHLHHVRGARLPSSLARNEYLRFAFAGAPIVLEPRTTYAYVLMFDEPAPGRAMALANHGVGNPYVGGTAIRREGARVVDPASDEMMVDDPNDAEDVRVARAHASFASLPERLAYPLGTIGMPDVCTYRDHVFFVEAAPVGP